MVCETAICRETGSEAGFEPVLPTISNSKLDLAMQYTPHLEDAIDGSKLDFRFRVAAEFKEEN